MSEIEKYLTSFSDEKLINAYEEISEIEDLKTLDNGIINQTQLEVKKKFGVKVDSEQIITMLLTLMANRFYEMYISNN